MNRHQSALLFSFVLQLSAGFVTDLSAQAYCDSFLTRPKEGPLGYRNRGDRCEGLYVEHVGSTTLLVVSLTESFLYDMSSDKPLQISWDRPPGNGVVRLRAQSIRRKLYYRMDTWQPAGSLSYNWSPDVLSSLQIQKDDIGIFGLARYPVGQTERDVYLPLRIRQDRTSPHAGSYKLILLPGVELTEVYISLALTGPDGSPKKFIQDGEKLGSGYYPAERSIEIPISGLKEKGTYYMEIGATLKSGGTSTVQIWFYNANG